MSLAYYKETRIKQSANNTKKEKGEELFFARPITYRIDF